MKKINYISLLIEILVILVCLFDRFFLLNLTGNFYFLVQLLLWSSVIIPIACFYKKRLKIKNLKQKFEYVIVFAILNLGSMFLFGCLTKFQYSIYSHTVIGILKNFCQLIVVYVLYELLRKSLIVNEKCKFDALMTIITMSFLYLNLIQFVAQIKTGLSFSYFFGTFLACLVTQVFLCYLTSNCGLRSALVWVLLPKVFEILSPILPKIEWFFNLLFVIAWPLMCFIFFYYTYPDRNINQKIKLKKQQKPYGIIAICVVIFLLVGFFTGMFGFYQTAIISNSMNPYFYRGDMVIVHKAEDYALNDVIQYRYENKKIVHRIVAINVENGVKYYITKGDSNNVNDNWQIVHSQVDGKVVSVIPKVGYLTLWIKELL